jgi:DNA-binding response OmpR family regulator
MGGFLSRLFNNKHKDSLKKRILIIEDEEPLSLLMKRILELKGGYETVIGRDGKEGLQLAVEKQPDLILLDINMPKMDGFEVLKRLKADKATLSIPVIMVSGNTDDLSKLKTASLYSDDYVTKPFVAEVLISKVKLRLGGA